MSSENRSAGELRQLALNILEQAKADPGYLDALKSDPEETLAAQGLTTGETRQLIGEFNLNEVEGYNGCQFTCEYSCNYGTCQITWCAHIPETGGAVETHVYEG